MSEPTTEPTEPEPRNIAREPATVEACQADYDQAAADRAGFDATAHRQFGDG